MALNWRMTVEAGEDGEILVVVPGLKKGELVDVIVSSKSTSPTIRRPGSAKGQIWMSDDFDEPLEEFRDYTE